MALLVSLVLLLVGASPAAAHTELASSDPADSAVLAAAPTRVSLVFTEEINADYVTVALTGPDGAQLPLEPAAVSVDTVTQALPAVSAGAFTVAYRVVSADGHPVQGSIGVTVEPVAVADPAGAAPASGAGAPTTTAEPSTTSVPDVAPQARGADSSGAPLRIFVGVPVLVLAGAGLFVARRSARR